MQPPGLGTERSQVSPDAEARWGRACALGLELPPKGRAPQTCKPQSPVLGVSLPPPCKPQPPLLGVSLPPHSPPHRVWTRKR